MATSNFKNSENPDVFVTSLTPKKGQNDPKIDKKWSKSPVIGVSELKIVTVKFFWTRKPMVTSNFENYENPDGFVTSLTPKRGQNAPQNR